MVSICTWRVGDVLDVGDSDGWVPVCAVMSLVVDPARMPTMDEARASHLGGIFDWPTPRRVHLKNIEAVRIGALSLDPDRVRRLEIFSIAASKGLTPEARAINQSAVQGRGRLRLFPNSPAVSALLRDE